MLGSQTWFLSLACPTILIGGFIASRKRLAYQWREELMDPESAAYPAVTDAEMEYFRRVAPGPVVEEAERKGLRNVGPEAMGVALGKEENIGLRVRSDAISHEEQNVYLNEVRRWAVELGNSIDARKVAVFEARVEQERDSAVAQMQGSSSSSTGNAWHGVVDWVKATFPYMGSGSTSSACFPSSELSLLQALDPGFYGKLRFISDHAEDIQVMRAPWGCGDRMLPEKMPSSLRHLVKQTEGSHEALGRLRHVYIEYSPTGKFFREPRTPKAYDGHDYVVIPLRRDGGDTVLTFAPALRSKFSVLTEVMANSWTSRDVDVFIPAGGMLRTYGGARYDWGWGIRPGPVWFGSRLNMVNRSIRASEAADDNKKRSVTPVRDGEAVSGVATSSRSTTPFPTTTSQGSTSAFSKPEDALPLKDAALVVLHFEGPRAENKQRSLLFQPEGLIFGKPPTVGAFDKWVDDRPTREDVQEEGVVRFMLKRYFEMLTVS